MLGVVERIIAEPQAKLGLEQHMGYKAFSSFQCHRGWLHTSWPAWQEGPVTCIPQHKTDNGWPRPPPSATAHMATWPPQVWLHSLWVTAAPPWRPRARTTQSHLVYVTPAAREVTGCTAGRLVGTPRKVEGCTPRAAGGAHPAPHTASRAPGPTAVAAARCRMGQPLPAPPGCPPVTPSHQSTSPRNTPPPLADRESPATAHPAQHAPPHHPSCKAAQQYMQPPL
jgi:hypothetical protein